MDSVTPISVSELTAQIRNLLEGNFQQVWIAGEVSNFTHHRSGHMYFTLKDENAEIRSVMFKGSNQFLRFTPEEGMKVFAYGRVTVFEKRGSYQLTVGKMEPAGLGALYLAYEALKKQLSEEGLFELDLKKPLPLYPKKIGVITSGTGAAVQDILQVLQRRAPYVSVLIRPTQVQGETAANDIVQAIADFQHYNDIDLLILGRGGGSLEDLWPFNEEKTARAIFRCDIPIISAVGHETDFTIADMVADMRAPTPSSAAELAAPLQTDIVQKYTNYQNTLDQCMQNMVERLWQGLDIQTEKINILQPGNQIQRNQKTLSILSHQLDHAWKNILQTRHSIIDNIKDQLEILNPQAVLERGYSIVYTSDGKIIRSAKDVNVGEIFEVQTGDGRMIAEKIDEK